MDSEGSGAPVLLTVFNRPDHTREVLEGICVARPRVLFVSADGPRAGRQDDVQRCREVRETVRSVDWDCDVRTRFHEQNLGLKRAMTTALDWFFSEVGEGIVLEDDCLPSPDFFRFCSELLERYRHDERVMQISGNNYLMGRHAGDASYYFSRLNDVSGWATWRRAWEHFDLAMRGFSRFRGEGRIKDYLPDPQIAAWLMTYLEEAYRADEREGIWSSAWAFAICSQNGLTAVPSVNLVTNIGFDRDATHAGVTFEPYGRIGWGALGEIRHPDFVIPDGAADRIRFELIRRTDPRLIPRGLLWRLKGRLRRVSWFGRGPTKAPGSSGGAGGERADE
jgi:hypothetical protein